MLWSVLHCVFVVCFFVISVARLNKLLENSYVIHLSSLDLMVLVLEYSLKS